MENEAIRIIFGTIMMVVYLGNVEEFTMVIDERIGRLWGTILLSTSMLAILSVCTYLLISGIHSIWIDLAGK